MRTQIQYIEITVNGVPRRVESNLSLEGLVAELKLAPRQVAVEMNQQLVPRRELGQHRLRAGDKLEIVSLAGGG